MENSRVIVSHKRRFFFSFSLSYEFELATSREEKKSFFLTEMRLKKGY